MVKNIVLSWALKARLKKISQRPMRKKQVTRKYSKITLKGIN